MAAVKDDIARLTIMDGTREVMSAYKFDKNEYIIICSRGTCSWMRESGESDDILAAFIIDYLINNCTMLCKLELTSNMLIPHRLMFQDLEANKELAIRQVGMHLKYMKHIEQITPVS